MLSKIRIKIICLILDIKLFFKNKIKRDAIDILNNVDDNKKDELKDLTNIED